MHFKEEIMDCEIFKNKNILITGGTGSFGQLFVKRVLSFGNVGSIVVVSRDEWKQWEMNRRICGEGVVKYVLGDVRDYNFLKNVMRGVDIVVHAAALKHVPFSEKHPEEFVKTNILGTINVINGVVHNGIEKMITLSTDKAVSPVNLYGSTKLCAEKLSISADKNYENAFSVVRYGNVLGSRGSVLSLWNKIIAEGSRVLPVTDERMTRFWITIEEAVDFVISCFKKMRGGEIFVPKIPSMKVVELVKAFGDDISMEICGVREGEKLHESLIEVHESFKTYDFDDHYVIAENVDGESANKVGDGFFYSSDSNDRWISRGYLRKFLDINALLCK